MTDPTAAEQIADEVTTKAASSHIGWHEQRQLMVVLITTALAEARRECVKRCTKAARDAIIDEYPGSDKSLERILRAIAQEGG